MSHVPTPLKRIVCMTPLKPHGKALSGGPPLPESLARRGLELLLHVTVPCKNRSPMEAPFYWAEPPQGTVIVVWGTGASFNYIHTSIKIVRFIRPHCL